MFRTQGEVKRYLWGGNALYRLFGKGEGGAAESWELSVHPDGVSRVGGELLTDYLARDPQAVDAEGSPLPVLIKYIDAARDLSVQVHPDDTYARRVENDNGKTELWYIVSAEEGAGILCGFRRDVTPEELVQKAKDGTVEELLNFIPVKAGDAFLIEAGTVHAIRSGCVVCEIQESSNVTYRIYDYKRKDAEGRERPLHLERALDVINFKRFEDHTNGGAAEAVEGGSMRLVASCEHFRVRELCLAGTYREQNGASFTAVNILEGKGTANGEPFSAGDTFFVPRGETFELSGEAKAILTDCEKKYYAGIDLGGTFVKCGITDRKGKILLKDSFPTGRERPHEEIAADMAACVLKLSEKLGVKVEAAGIGSPGTVDSARGVIVYSNNIKWKDVPLGGAVERALGVPVFVTNDANAAALGECRCGAGSDYSDVVLVTLGTGVGGGIVLGGKLFEGGKSAGAEIGHTVIRMGGERCTCGRRGCLEAYASATALVRDTVRAMKKHPESLMNEIAGGKEPDGRTAFLALERGDRTARRVVNGYIRALAEGLANLANVFRPQAILLGGGICGAGDALLVPLRRRFNALLYGGSDYAPVLLKTATLGNDAGLCGAAMFAADRM